MYNFQKLKMRSFDYSDGFHEKLSGTNPPRTPWITVDININYKKKFQVMYT